MKDEVIHLDEKMKMVTEAWTPKIIEQINNYQIKLAVFEGVFTWHKHDETDEVFYVINGDMGIEFRDKKAFLTKGDLYVVPKGIEHKPFAEEPCQVMLIEPAGTVNTGDSKECDLTASNKDWI